MTSCPHQLAAAAGSAAESGSAAVELHQNHQNSPAHTNSLAASSCRNAAAAAAGSDSAAAAAEFGSAATLTEIAACSAAAEKWTWHSHLHSGFAAAVVVVGPMSVIVAGLVFVRNPIQQWVK